MRFLGLTPWRIFLVFGAAFWSIVILALLGYRRAVVACHGTGRVAVVVGAVAFLAAYALRGWQMHQERKRGDIR